jgi:hypothetical protein
VTYMKVIFVHEKTTIYFSRDYQSRGQDSNSGPDNSKEDVASVIHSDILGCMEFSPIKLPLNMALCRLIHKQMVLKSNTNLQISPGTVHRLCSLLF